MNHQTDNTAYSTAHTNVGSIVPNPAWFNTASVAEAIHNMHHFHVKQCENGWTISYGGKEYVCNDVKEVGDRMVAILVQERLTK